VAGSARATTISRSGGFSVHRDDDGVWHVIDPNGVEIT
jgi:hypothetical protein